MANGKVSILVVEDESIVALALQRKLRAMGYTTPEHAVSGEEAIEKAVRLAPNLVLMDIRLVGVMDGISAAEEIQRRLDVPVVYISAYADPTTIARARATNAFGYLIKPFNDAVLQETVANALAGRRGEEFWHA